MSMELTVQDLSAVIETNYSYCGKQRFDRGLVVTQLLFRGLPLLSAETGNTFGVGLCDEFGIKCPVGFEECSVGDWFIKPGVGLLQRISPAPYGYTDILPLQECGFSYINSTQAIRCVAGPLSAGEFGVAYEKEIHLSGDSLRICYLIKNTGKRFFEIEHYCHNFFRVGQTEIGRKYSLTLTGEQDFTYIPDLMAPPKPRYRIQHGDGVTRFQFGAQPNAFFATTGSYPCVCSRWELCCESGCETVRICGSSSTQASKFNLWGCPEAICPELYTNIALMPGETFSWQSVYLIGPPSNS